MWVCWNLIELFFLFFFSLIENLLRTSWSTLVMYDRKYVRNIYDGHKAEWLFVWVGAARLLSVSERANVGGNIESFLACEKPCERRIFMQHSLCDNFKHESELMAIGFGLFFLSHTLGSAFCCDSKLFSCCRMLGMVKWGGECIYRAGEKGNFILLCFLPCTGEWLQQIECEKIVKTVI